MPTLERDGAVLNYEIWQDAPGPWVTFVNGHTRPLNDFRMFGKRLIEQGFRILALDNRGAGKTTYDRPFSLEDMVSDVAALWRELDIEKTCLAGISMGGFIAQTLALAHPTHIARLALISTACSQTMITPDERAWSDDPEAVLTKLSAHFTDDFRARNETLVKSMAKQIAQAVARDNFAVHSQHQKAALQGFDTCSRLSSLHVPTLIVHGAEDRVIPLAAAHQLAELIPNAQLTVLESAGHLLLAERPRELYAAVGGFFQAI